MNMPPGDSKLPKSRILRLAGSIALFLGCCLVLCAGAYARAETQSGAEGNGDHPSGNPFVQGSLSFQLVSGALFSLRNLPEDSPDFNYAQTNLRLGYMLTSPDPQGGFFRGNWEGLVEISNSIIFQGFGNYIGGITALFRYNFLQPDWQVIPYIQGGAGIVYNDAYKDETQRAIGQAIEFTPQFSVGLHYRVTSQWAVDLEGMLHHISNAGMSQRNRSINALGGFVGVTYFWGSD